MLFLLISGCTNQDQQQPPSAEYNGPRSYLLAPSGSDMIIHVHYDKYRDNAEFASAVNSFFGAGIDENVKALGLAAGINRNLINTITIASKGSPGNSDYRLVILDGDFTSNPLLAKGISESAVDYKGVIIYNFGNGSSASSVAILGTGVAVAGSAAAVRESIDISKGTQGYFSGQGLQAFKRADLGSYLTFASKPTSASTLITKSDFFALGARTDGNGQVLASGFALFDSEQSAAKSLVEIRNSLSFMQAAFALAGMPDSPALGILNGAELRQEGNFAIISINGSVADFKAGISDIERVSG